MAELVGKEQNGQNGQNEQSGQRGQSTLPLKGQSLLTLAGKALAWRRHLEDLTTEPSEVAFLEEAALCGALDAEINKSSERANTATLLLERLRNAGRSEEELEERTSWQQGGTDLAFVRCSDGIERRFVLEEGLLQSEQARRLHETRTAFSFLLEPVPAVFRYGERERIVSRPSELADFVLEAGGEGLVLQRYKGLGEMNPEQLWETTLNPETRVLVKVDIGHRAKASGLFETLMGEKVEPRRKFIEENALRAAGIDV